jgi:glycerophosphoryl diester phosphodiesterase
MVVTSFLPGGQISLKSLIGNPADGLDRVLPSCSLSPNGFRQHEWVHPPAPRHGPPIGFAHRGGRAGHRENTLSAFGLALRQGATGLESDAWLTADGEVVLHHDALTGPPWRRRPLSGQLRADLPSYVPTLDQLYDGCGTAYELSLDVKDPAAAPKIIDVAAAHDVAGRAWLCHHDVEQLARWREASEEVRLVHSTRRRWIPAATAAHAEVLRRAGIDALNLPHHEWTADAVAAVHAGGVWAFGWGAQSSPDIRAVLDLGADGVYSDHVTRMMDEVARS